MASHLEASPALRLSQLQAIYDGVQVGLCLLDRNFRYLNHNNLFVEVISAPFGPHLGKTVEETSPILFLQIERYLRRALRGEAISDVEVLVEKPGFPSEFNPQLMSLQPVRDETGEIMAISVSVTDITLQNQLVRRLREGQDHYPDGRIKLHLPLSIRRRGKHSLGGTNNIWSQGKRINGKWLARQCAS